MTVCSVCSDVLVTLDSEQPQISGSAKCGESLDWLNNSYPVSKDLAPYVTV